MLKDIKNDKIDKEQNNKDKELDLNKSYLIKTNYTYKELLDKYTNIFKKFINNGSSIESLTKEEKEKLFMGIKDITNYIADGFIYTFTVSKKGVDPREKILIAVYNRIVNLKMSLFSDECANSKNIKSDIINSLNENIIDKVEFSVFCALGLERYHKRGFVWNYLKQKEYNLIYFIKYRVAAIIIEEYLKNEIESINNIMEYEFNNSSKLISDNTVDSANMEKRIDVLSGEELIELSGCKWIIPPEYYDNIVDFLNGHIDKEDLLLGEKKTKKLLTFIYKNLKKKGYVDFDESNLNK